MTIVRAASRAGLLLSVLVAAMFATPASAQAGAPSIGTFRIHAIDVGTGLSIFVEGHDFTLLYDAGSNDDVAVGADNRVVAYIRRVRPDLTIIDHLILSHPHQDHSELMPDILTAFTVRNVWDSGSLNNICSYRALLANVRAESGVTYHDALGGPGTHLATFPAKAGNCYGRPAPRVTIRVPRGSRISRLPVSLGVNAQMTILHADGTRRSAYNEATVVVRLDLGARRILLAGDAEGGERRPPTDPPRRNTVEADVLRCCAAGLRSDILVVGHHGSMTSSRTAFLNAVGASQFIVSSGPTRYQSVTLPDAAVLRQLRQRGTLWRTDANDAACGRNPAKIGPDNDGRPGGCDNILISIDRSAVIRPGYNRISD